MKSVVMTRKGMADLFVVSTKTFNRLLEDHGIYLKRGVICPKDQELIFSKLGYPPGYEKWYKFRNNW